MKPVEIEFLIKNGTKATLDKISTDVTKVGTNAVDVSNAITNSIAKATKVLAAGYSIQQLASQLYSFSNNYDKALREVSTISQVVSDDIEGYRQTILNMTGEIPVAADEATKALYQIISAGHDGAEGLNVLEVSAKAAIGGVTDTALAADTITTLLNAYKLSADEAENVSDMLFTTVKLGKTTMGELGQSIAQVAPIAASFGIEMDQVLGAVATLTKSGTPTAQAMTQIRAGVIAATKVLGDGYFATHTLQEGLAEIMEMSGGSETKLRELVPEVEGLNAVLGLTGINAETAASDLGLMTDAAGATQVAYEKMLEGTDQQLVLLKNNALAYFSALGDGVLDSVGSIAAYLNEAFQSGDIERFGEVVMVLVSAFGIYKGSVVATNVVMKVQNALITEAIIQKKLAAAAGITLSNAEAMAAARTTLLSAAQYKLVAALKAVKAAMLSNPWTAALVGITAVVSAIVWFRDRTEDATEEVTGLKKAIADANAEFDKEASKVKALQSIVENGNVAYAERKKALDELKGIIPGYNADLTTEGILIDNNTSAIKEYLVQLEKQIKMKAVQEELEEAYRQKRLLENEQKDLTSEAQDLTGQIKDAHGYNKMAGRKVGRLTEEYVEVEAKIRVNQESINDVNSVIEELTKEIETSSLLTVSTPNESEDQILPNYSEAYKKAEEEWKDAKSSYEAIKDDKLATVEDFNAASKKLEDAEKAFQALGGTTKETKVSSTEQSDIERANKELLSLRIQNKQAEIDLMADGSEKKIEQIKLNYTKEIAEIVAQEEKWKAAQEGELTDEQTVEITKAKTSAKSQAEKDTADVTATELAENKKKINALLEQYQTLDQKRKAIDSAYAKDKTALETELKRLQDTGEDTTNVEASLEARETAYKNSIKSLQSEIVQSTEFYNKLFSSFSDKGYTVLKDFYKEAKNVIESAVVSGDSVTVAIPELTEDGSIVEKQVKITVAEYQKMVNQLVSMGDELEKDNPFKAVYNSFSDMLTAIKEGDTDAFSNSMESLQSAVDSTVGTMSQWGDSLETIFGDTVGQAFDEIVQLTEGVLDLGIGIGQIYSGDVIGGITSVLSGIASIVECLTSWREKEEEQQRSWYLAELEVNRLLEERNYELAESRNTIADILADTEALAWLVKNGFATESSSSEWSSAMSAFEEANSNLESEMARYEELWDKVQSSNAEWSGKSGSLSWYSVTQSLKGMTEAEIELYYQQGKLSDSAEDYYEAWVESGESIEELMDTIDELYASMREMVMGVSFDSWLSNAASALQSMQSDISALGDFTEETLTDALLNAFMYQRLADVLEPLYNELSDALIDGSADADFISDWKEQFEEIMSDASDEYAALADAMGISSSTTQSGNSGSFETMSQDQGTKLEGLFTAAEIHLDSIDDNVVEMKDDIEEVSIQMSNATGYLKTIAENTTESKTTLADLYTTFKKMISDGLKIK